MPGSLPPHIAVDFGSHSLKLIQLVKQRNDIWEVKALSSVQTPPEVTNSYKEEHKTQLVESMKELVADANPTIKEVAVALPENTVFSRVLTIPKVSDDELTATIYWQLKQYLPYPIEDVQSDHTVLSVDQTGQRKVLVVAAPKKLVDLYVEILERAGLLPVAVESETLASLRTIRNTQSVTDAVILDLGANSTDMAIMVNSELFFSQSIGTGSDLLTKALVNEFQLSYAQAEEYKRSFGMKQDVGEGKVKNAIKPVLDIIITEVMRGIEFFKTEIMMQPPAKVILTGEGALLPALSEYVNSVLGYEVSLADPFEKVVLPEKLQATLKQSGPAYTVAIGLCMKED